jgi:hypothetical protein
MEFNDEEQIRIVINKFIELYRQDSNRWQNERYAHYDFFKLLFDTFEPIDIKNNFKWEYPVGVPSYGGGTKEAAVDIIYLINSGKWVAIEIELVHAGKVLESELTNCVLRLKTSPKCNKEMIKGFIIPLISRTSEKKVRKRGIYYSDYFQEQIEKTIREIGKSPIELITDGIILL